MKWAPRQLLHLGRRSPSRRRDRREVKEGFRQWLLNHFPDPDILLNKNRMPGSASPLARDNKLPTEVMMDISRTYVGIAEDHRSAAGTQCQSETGDHRYCGSSTALID